MRKKQSRYRKATLGRSRRRTTRLTFLQVAIPAALLGTFGALAYNLGNGGPVVRTDTGDDSVFTCNSPTVVDGDTLRCGAMRVRLQGIDAPETGGRCQPGRVCAPGDPVASTDNLRRLVAGGAMDCRQTDTDKYGRAVALCAVGGVDLSCEQVRSGNAIRR